MISSIFNSLYNNYPLKFGNSKVNVVVLNDIHGSTSFIDNFITARDEFYRQNDDGVNFTLSGGDMFAKSSDNNSIVAKFIKDFVDVSAVGNHDLSNSMNFSNLMKRFRISKNFVSANLNVEKNAPIPLKRQIASSTIIEDNGERFGFIGVSPIDLEEHISRNKDNDFVTVKNFDKTKKAIKSEVKKLEANGVSKIFLLAHTGEYSDKNKTIDYYKEFAEIGGIDVIIGGHDHIKVDKWFLSKRKDKKGWFEPVKVMATGDSKTDYFSGTLNMFGTMNLNFDDDGVLIPEKCKTNFKLTQNYGAVDYVSKYIPKYAKKVIAKLPEPICSDYNPLKSENKVANLIADVNMLYAQENSKSGEMPDFAFLNSGTLRDVFSDTNITRYKIRQVLPFGNNLVMARLTKAQIYEVLGVCSKAIIKEHPSPGVMQVSHMSYGITPNGEVFSVKILDDYGRVKYNLDEMPDNAKFNCVMDDFLASGASSFKCIKTKPIENFNISSAEILEKFFLSNEPLPNYNSKRIYIIN